MISPTVSEEIAKTVWPDADHNAVVLSVTRKSERIVLVSTQTKVRFEALAAAARRSGVPTIAAPQRMFPVFENRFWASASPIVRGVRRWQ